MADGSQQGYGSQQMNPWGNLFGGLGNLWGANQIGNVQFSNPANAAMPYMNQIPAILQQYLSPYMSMGAPGMANMQAYSNAGLQALPQLQGILGQLTSNPGAFLNQMGQSFHQSPGYAFQTSQALNAANRAAAAGGMEGSPMEQQNIAATTNQLANQDYYNYLNNAENMFGQGLSGLEGINQMGYGAGQNMANMGYGASNNLAEMLSQNLQNQANLAYAGQANQNQFNQGQAGAEAGMDASGMGGIGNFLGSLFGGGSAGGTGGLFSALGNFF